jgi:subtilisin family serine protease
VYSEDEALLTRKREEVDPTRITFRSGITIHPRAGMEAGVRETLAAADGGSSDKMWLIQFRYPFPTEARARLQDAGVKFYDYVDVCGLIARVPPGALPLLEEMLEEGIVRYVGSIPAEAKVQRTLVTEAAGHPESEQEVVVLTFDQPSAAQLEQLGRLMTIKGQSSGPIPFVEGTSPTASLQALAQLDFVRWVEERDDAELGNLDGGMGVGADLVRATGYDGSGVQVMVVDSGIARDGETYHPDLQADRILAQWNYYTGEADAVDDYWLGHGTHVAGTIGGQYNALAPISDQSYQGVAPGADLLIYKLCCGSPQLSPSWFQDALIRATTDPLHAHVSNNSWGGGGYGTYELTSEIADAAVRGEEIGRPVSVVAAAMNNSYLVRSPGTGKNVVTVGAVKDGNYPNTSLPDLGTCEDDDWPPGERLCYSNYGPIDSDGDDQWRVKPDLVAPGALITSAVPWYLIRYEGEYYGSLHGTSQATPHITGAIAQMLDAYSVVEDGALFEWPEMVKAMLLAAAVDVGVEGVQGQTYYGHGMLDAYHAILHEPGVDEPMEVWGSSMSATRETQEFGFFVPEGYKEIRVVLTWADPPGAAEAINDLDVSIWDDERELAGQAASQDDTVEYVRIDGGYTPGTWTARVVAESVTGEQPFALAAHVIMAEADLSIKARPASVPGTVPSFVPGGEFYLHQHVSNSGYTAGGSYAKLQATAGFTVTGVTIFTGDNHEHWYDASELYHDPAFPNDWYVAVGDTIASEDRHVRWSIEIGQDVECGSYLFQSAAYWREAGVQRSSTTETIQIPVACHFTYLPLVLKGG